MKVLVIIPAYNEEKNIIGTVKSLECINEYFTLDYIVINDGSKDNTASVCIKNNIKFINLVNNLGIGGAVQTGYKYAYLNDYDVAIQFDGDGQHDASFIINLVDEINKGYDLVVGSRFIKKTDGFNSTFLRRLGIKFLSLLIKICTGKKIYDPTSGFRACNKRIIYDFAFDYPLDYPEPDTIVSVIKRGYKVNEISVRMHERKEGKSSLNINIFEPIYYMIKVSVAIIITSLSVRKEDKK